MKYKIVYVKLKNKKKVLTDFPFLAGSTFKKGDMVILEGIPTPCEVEKYIEFDDMTIPYNPTSLRKVLGEYVKTKVELKATIDSEFYYPLYHADKIISGVDEESVSHFIDDITLINKGTEKLENARIEIEFNNDIFTNFNISIPLLKGKSKMPITDIFPNIDFDKYNFTEVTPVDIDIKLFDGDDIISSQKLVINAHPLDELPPDYKYDKRYLLKYLTDYNMKKELSYDIKKIQDLFESLKSLKLNLVNDNKMLLPYQVLAKNSGNKESIATYIATLMNFYSFNPLFIFDNDNIYVGVYGKEYPDLAGKDRIVNAIEKNQIVVFDPVDLTNSNLFDRSRINVLEHLKHSENPLALIVSDYTNSPFERMDSMLDLTNSSKLSESNLSEEVTDRFTSWERKLLDLSEMNPLISTKLKETNSIRVVSKESFPDIVKKFSSFKLSQFINAEGVIERYLVGDTEINKEELPDGISAIGLNKTLTEIVKKNRVSLEETGSPIIYLTLGLIKYNRKNGNDGYAPFLVLPVSISSLRKTEFNVSYDYDDIMINEAFFEYYHTMNPYVNFEDLYALDMSMRYVDICKYFSSLNLDDVVLLHDIYTITTLTFSHYVMWKDIKERRESLSRNKFISSFIKNESLVKNSNISSTSTINDREKYASFVAPRSYDSTQLDAILSSADGESFILDGPPGSGKSQTIVNIIANAIYNGKTVMFVAMKKAALDVVYDRLKSLGLDEFALELHSKHANKQDFFARLKEVLAKDHTITQANYNDTIFDLEAKKSEIENVIYKMHNKKYNYSLYDSIVMYENNKKYRDVELPSSFLIGLDDDKTKDIIEILDNLEYLSSTVSNFDNSVLKALDVTEIGFYDKEKFYKAFTDLNYSFTRYYKDVLNLCDRLNVAIPYKNSCISKLLDIFDILYSGALYSDHIHDFLVVGDISKYKEILAKAKEVKEFIDTHTYYNYSLLKEIDYDKAIDELTGEYNFIKKTAVNNYYKKELKTILKPTHRMSKNLVSYYEEIESYNEKLSFVSSKVESFRKLTGINLLENLDNLSNVFESFDNTIRISNLINDFESTYDLMGTEVLLEKCISDSDTKLLYVKLKQDYEKHILEYDNVNSQFKINYHVFDSFDDEFDRFKSFTEGVLKSTFNDVVNMGKLNIMMNTLTEMGVENLVTAIKASSIRVLDLKETYLKSIASGFIKLYFEDDDINYFSEPMFETSVLRYKTLLDEYSNDSVLELKRIMYERIDSFMSTYSSPNPVGKLKKAITTGKGMSVRRALLDYDTLIKTYFPVVLMSPLSVSQYLGGADFNLISKYDLVIFDEASQIPLHEAISAVSKGNSLIVAGDEMQMPPSNYFKGAISNAMEDEDSDSLLSECLAIGFDRKRLKFHYRSRHESLIEFSNKAFYNSELYTFPSSDSDSFKVKVNYLEVKKDTSGLSDIELDAIIEELRKIYTDEDRKNRSVGIIVFNVTEVELLETKLNKFLENNPLIERQINEVANNTGEPLFIKSLENVQGDERDIIILSIAFTKNSLGHPYINGPLVRVNGEKRLNVALSRSKQEMIVLSTIKYSDFEMDERIRSNGAKLLKDFLKFAENGYEKKKQSSNVNTEIARIIKNDLDNLGYQSNLSVGMSHFKVDLGILAPDGTYALGILIDPSVGDNTSLRDVLSVKEMMLKKLGWKIIRVYSLEYYKDKENTLQKIINNITNPFVSKTLDENKPKEKSLYDVRPYKDTIISSITYDKIRGFMQLENYLDVIVKTESPISLNRIKTIIRDKSGLKVLSSRMEEMIEVGLMGMNFTLDQGTRFYWESDNNHIDHFRLASKRGIMDIAKEELANALAQVVSQNDGITRDELFDMVVSLFKFEYVQNPEEIKTRLEYVYKYARDNSLI